MGNAANVWLTTGDTARFPAASSPKKAKGPMTGRLRISTGIIRAADDQAEQAEHYALFSLTKCFPSLDHIPVPDRYPESIHPFRVQPYAVLKDKASCLAGTGRESSLHKNPYQVGIPLVIGERGCIQTHHIPGILPVAEDGIEMVHGAVSSIPAMVQPYDLMGEASLYIPRVFSPIQPLLY